MRDPNENNIVKIDPGTLLAIVAALILVPLLLTGFLSQ
jgi:hypothetical protein